MNIIVRATVVGAMPGELRAFAWPDGMPIPREGEEVELPDVKSIPTFVRHVVWYPFGNPDEGIEEPFVYLVIGKRRPSDLM